jgi:hypothetical protein
VNTAHNPASPGNRHPMLNRNRLTLNEQLRLFGPTVHGRPSETSVNAWAVAALAVAILPWAVIAWGIWMLT